MRVSIDDILDWCSRIISTPIFGPTFLILSSPLFAITALICTFFTFALFLPVYTVYRYAITFLTRRRSDAYSWANQIVLITGAANGVGRELMDVLLSQTNVKLILACDIVPIAINNDRVKSYILDISNRVFVRKVVDRIAQQYGNPTALVNCAGMVRGKHFADMSELEYEKTIAVNLTGTLHVIKSMIPLFDEGNQGHIVTLSSILGFSGLSNLSDYTASQGGLISFHEALRQELHERPNNQVKVSLIHTGLIDTGMLDGVSPSFSFFSPVLQPHDVALRIKKVLESGQNNNIVLPFMGLTFPYLRLLPIGCSDWIRRFWRLNADMNKFVGSKNAIDLVIPPPRSGSSMSGTSSSPSSSSYGSPILQPRSF